MWKLYSSETKGIVIKTTYKQLKNILNENFYIGLVSYTDEIDLGLNLIKKYFFKRRIYSNENELRVIYFEPSQTDNGYLDYKRNGSFYTLDIDPTTFINEIILSPSSNELLQYSVKNIIPATINVQESELASDHPMKFQLLHNIFLQLLKNHGKKDCKICSGRGYFRDPSDTQQKTRFCTECIDNRWDDFLLDLLNQLNNSIE